MIHNFLDWEGFRVTRVNTQGQHMMEKYKGKIVSHGYRPSQTRRGTADLSATIRGRSVMMEIKAGRDRPSEHQLREQEIERRAGGIYEFIYTPDDFFNLYDKLIE